MMRDKDKETSRRQDPAKAEPDETQEPWPVRPVRTWSGEIRYQPETQKTLQEWIRRARNHR